MRFRAVYLTKKKGSCVTWLVQYSKNDDENSNCYKNTTYFSSHSINSSFSCFPLYLCNSLPPLYNGTHSHLPKKPLQLVVLILVFFVVKKFNKNFNGYSVRNNYNVRNKVGKNSLTENKLMLEIR